MTFAEPLMHLLYTPSQYQCGNTPRCQSRRPKKAELRDGRLWLVDVGDIVRITERNSKTSLDNSRKQDSVPVFYKKSMQRQMRPSSVPTSSFFTTDQPGHRRRLQTSSFQPQP